MPDGSPPPDPLLADERAIEREVRRANLTNDPMRHPLAAFLRGVREIRIAAERARHPLPPGALSEAVDAGARLLARRFPWLVAGASALLLLSGFAAGCLAVGIAWRSDAARREAERVAVAEELSLALRDARGWLPILRLNPNPEAAAVLRWDTPQGSRAARLHVHLTAPRVAGPAGR